MKYSAILTLLLMISAISVFAKPQGLSARRLPQESSAEASSRAKLNILAAPLDSNEDTAEDLQGPLQDLDLQSVPELPSTAALTAQFDFVRDTQFIHESTLKFPRRLSWLYPDDGCYIRAELAAQFLREKGFVSPKKIYAFGDLTARTKNSPYGTVTWWYHVAAIYRVGNIPYVFDPAIDPEKPLTLEEWNRAIGGTKTTVNYSLCSAFSEDPRSTCEKTTAMPRNLAITEQMSFLEDEWSRLEELHRNPEAELGEKPPWKHSLNGFEFDLR